MLFKQLITCYLQLHFAPKSYQIHTKVRAKLSFSYVSLMVVVTFEYLIYDRAVTMCISWRKICDGHSTACFSMDRIRSGSLPVNRRLIQLSKTVIEYYAPSTLEAIRYDDHCGRTGSG